MGIFLNKKTRNKGIKEINLINVIDEFYSFL
jgi:hypothetical protein